ncbi:MAG: 4-hydroxythreonine-4-phosphate dehydrogenase PdxA [Opitutales bacterium]|nr:4-hydroxythreonine-4-phosphate dehydrogenase PdxA [Opitutales bacterium]
MKKIALTVGDPCGVGREIIKKWIASHPADFGGVKIFAHAEFLSELPGEISKCEIPASAKFIPGNPCAEGAQLALDALKAAAKSCETGECSAVVTAPVSKFWMKKVSPDFVGQTEFFESQWGGAPVMCFAGERMIVSLATWHIPLSEVPRAINAENIGRAVSAAAALAKKIRKAPSPKIAVCGLNPHAGEGGILGMEEIEIINPAIESLKEKYPNLSLALPPDTVFNRHLKGEFDAVVAMYHDQGLAPLKSIEFDCAVNISMGLSHIRTSPDHGTGFDIAGKNIASPNSFAKAVELAKLLA